ncbi:MAG: hypothetical protein ACRDXF_00320 [Acidimicrobiia bacterium]
MRRRFELVGALESMDRAMSPLNRERQAEYYWTIVDETVELYGLKVVEQARREFRYRNLRREAA